FAAAAGRRFVYSAMTYVEFPEMCSRSLVGRVSAPDAEFDCTLFQRFSSHSRTVSLVRQAALREPARGLTRLIAARFMSKSIVAYRLVVVGLACPSHWLMVERSTPDLSRATAVLCLMLCGCRRFLPRVATSGLAWFTCLA